TAVAAWANAANAAMLADCFRIGGQESLKQAYLAHAVEAWDYADGQADPQLEKVQDVGGQALRGADFKMTAAAYLFNLTGDKRYEDAVNKISLVSSDTADMMRKDSCQIWATAGFVLSPRPTRFPRLRERMKKAVIFNALEKEVALAGKRP